MMKYIRVEQENGQNEIITFPMGINHDVMYEGVMRLKNHIHGDWKRVYREIISAGFVAPDGKCFGRSITLGVGSLGDEDTEILKAQLKEGI